MDVGTVQLEKLCSWLKHRLVTSKESYSLSCTAGDSEARETGTENSTSEAHQTGRKRKISWEILHPLKHRRLLREESEPIATVQSHFGLADVRGSMFPGHQSTATSLCAILRCQTAEPSSWTANVIDKILIQGDRLHSVRLSNMESSRVPNTSLSPEELPTNITMEKNEYKLTVTRLKSPTSEEECVQLDKSTACRERLCQQITDCLIKANSAMLLGNEETVQSMFTDGSHVYLFNPKKKSHDNLFRLKYVSTLHKFRDVTHACRYLLRKWLTHKSESVGMWRVAVEVDCHTWSQLSASPYHPWV